MYIHISAEPDRLVRLVFMQHLQISWLCDLSFLPHDSTLLFLQRNKVFHLTLSEFILQLYDRRYEVNMVASSERGIVLI